MVGGELGKCDVLLKKKLGGVSLFCDLIRYIDVTVAERRFCRVHGGDCSGCG